MWERVLTKVLRMATGQSLNVSIRRSRCGDPMAQVYGRDRIGILLCRLLTSILIFAAPLTTLAQDNAISGEPLSRDILAGESADDASPIDVKIDSGLLSLHSRGAPLAEVLTEISRQAGIELVMEGELGYPVSKSFSNEPLIRALQRLLSATNYIMVYGPSKDTVSPPYLVALRIYGISPGARSSTGAPDANSKSGAGSLEDAAIALRAVTLGLAPTAEGDEGLHEEIAGLERDERILAMQWLADFEDSIAVATLGRFLALDKDSAVRSEAAFALSGIGGDAAAEALEMGLGDGDPGVRLEVVDALSGIKDSDTALRLGRVLFGEPDPEVRLFAVVGLGEEHSEAAWALLEAAADDPDRKVSETANLILATWE